MLPLEPRLLNEWICNSVDPVDMAHDEVGSQKLVNDGLDLVDAYLATQ